MLCSSLLQRFHVDSFLFSLLLGLLLLGLLLDEGLALLELPPLAADRHHDHLVVVVRDDDGLVGVGGGDVGGDGRGRRGDGRGRRGEYVRGCTGAISPLEHIVFSEALASEMFPPRLEEGFKKLAWGHESSGHIFNGWRAST